MRRLIKVYSDYVCPYCFLAEVPLQEAIHGNAIEVDRQPFELRPDPEPALRPEDEYLRTEWAQEVYPLAARMGIKIKLPAVSPQPHTHLAFEGYQYAQEHGKGELYHRAVLEAFFEEGKDIGKPGVLAQIAAELGLNILDFEEALATRRYRAAHQRALREAAEAGITAVPTFVVGDRILVGMPAKEELEAAIEAASETVAVATCGRP